MPAPTKRTAPILRGSRPEAAAVRCATIPPSAAQTNRALNGIASQITFGFSALLSVNAASPVWGRALVSRRMLAVLRWPSDGPGYDGAPNHGR